eukprot:6622145-Alexandrium_andersonii.AAC.1
MLRAACVASTSCDCAAAVAVAAGAAVVDPATAAAADSVDAVPLLADPQVEIATTAHHPTAAHTVH